jgi:hypothetical protein
MKTRHARACPGHPRLYERHGKKDVDGRDKPGHDEKRIIILGMTEMV